MNFINNWIDKIEDLRFNLDLQWLFDFIIVIASGLLIAALISAVISKVLSNRASIHYTQLIRSTSYYSLLTLTLIIALPISPMNLAALGAVLTLAIGFAARTPLSNVINGLILVFESPFVIDDEIQIQDKKGKVLAIDLLSVVILTKENTVIRLPNEVIFSNQTQNFTRFKIRKCDITLFVSYKQNVQELEANLQELANANKQILQTPVPTMFINNFNEHSIELVFSVWVPTDIYDHLKTSFKKDVISLIQKLEIKLPEISQN